MKPRPCHADIFAALVFAATALLYWAWHINGTRTDIGGWYNLDVFAQTYPMAVRAAAWMREGELPLWNPFQFCGQPFLASTLYQVLYPPAAIFLLLPVRIAIEAQLITHLAMAGLFTYAYCRTAGAGRPPALFAGAAFMLSSFMTAQAWWFSPPAASAIWLPLALLSIERMARGEPRWTVGLALAVALPALGGWMQTWVYSLYAIAAYAAVRLAAELHERRAWWDTAKVGLLLAAGIALGLALAAAQLLPGLELRELGPRSSLSAAQVHLHGHWSPRDLLAQIAGATTTRPRYAYLGVAPLLFLPFSLLAAGRRTQVAALWLLLVSSVCIALTIHTPVFALFERFVPGAMWFRVPQRILYLGVFAAAALAGFGLDAFLAAGAAARRERLRAVAMLAVTAVALTALIGSVGHLRSLLHLALAAAASAAALSRRRAIAGWAAVAIGVLVAIDLAAIPVMVGKRPYHGTELTDGAAGALRFIKGRQGYDRTYLAEGLRLDYSTMNKQGTLHQVFSVTDYEPLSLRRYQRFFHAIAPHQVDEDARFLFWGRLRADPALPQFRLLDLMSVRFVLLHQTLDTAFNGALLARDDGWRQVYTQTPGDFVVYERPRALPRAYVAYSIEPVAGEDAALRAIVAPSFDPWRSVVVEAAGKDLLLPDSTQAIAPARIVGHRPTRVTIEVSTRNAGLLVLTDTHYPGWRAYVDADAAPIYSANYLFRGVRVPAGRHTVTFEYKPGSFRLGAAVSLTALALIVVGAARVAFAAATARA